MKLKLQFPTAGFTPFRGAPKLVSPTSAEKILLRELAKKVTDIAAEPIQEDKRKLWYAHNRLQKTRPLALLYPENGWDEIMDQKKLEAQSPFWKHWEWYLRQLMYRHENFCDDFVIEPDLYVNKIINSTGWGVEADYHRSENEKGSWAYDPPLKNPDNLKKLKIPEIEVDQQETNKLFDAINSVFGDILNIRLHCLTPVANLITTATMFRGIQQVMMDMYDRPKWLHELMTIIGNGVLHQALYLEENGHLTLNNRNHYTNSGSIGYTDELPGRDFDAKHVKLKDLWGFGVGQELSEVGPDQHEEFLLNYQLKILKRFGLNSYGCCEPLTKKFDMVKKVPRLRRASISPWCDPKVAAKKLGDKYIYSWKYNPSKVVNTFHPEQIRADIRDILAITKGCVLEIILKDIITIKNEPQRLKTWTKIVNEEINKI